MAAGRTGRRKRGAAAEGFGRTGWLRIAAVLLGIVVLLGHVYAPRHPLGHTSWYPPNMLDVAKHSAMLFIFSATYFLSWRGQPGRAAQGSSWLGPGPATAFYCGGWGAFCEIIQLWIYGRQFSPIELGINVLVPVLTAGLLSAIIWDNFRP